MACCIVSRSAAAEEQRRQLLETIDEAHDLAAGLDRWLEVDAYGCFRRSRGRPGRAGQGFASPSVVPWWEPPPEIDDADRPRPRRTKSGLRPDETWCPFCDYPHTGEPCPSPEEIAQRAAEVRAGWEEPERRRANPLRAMRAALLATG